jgi:trimeric autotransporter adhesin
MKGAGTGLTGDLRYAINQVNAGSGGDTIRITATGTIVLGSALPVLQKAVVISGPGADQLTPSGNGAVRVLEIASPAVVAIDGMTIADGVSSGNSGFGAACWCERVPRSR